MNKINLNVLQGPKFRDALSGEDNIPYFIGYISAKELVENYEIPYVSSEKKNEGYQRPPGTSRIKAFAKIIASKKVDFPTLVLLNIRNEKAKNHLNDRTFSYIPNIHGSLYAEDGQHRILALKHAIEYAIEQDNINLLDKLNNIQIPFGLTITESVLNEMIIFYDVNSNAKGVPANVKDLIQKKRVEAGDKELLKEMDSSGDSWKLIATDILEEVVLDYDNVWFKRIKFPNEKNIKSPNVGNFAMTKYLSNIINSNEAKMVSDKRSFSMEVFNAYWKGFELACPDAFYDNASKYSIQTAMGADVFMRLWGFMKDWIRQNESDNNQNLREPETYKNAFRKIIENSSGYDQSENLVEGLKYWEKGSAAGAQGAGEAGKTALTKNLERWLTQDV
jgi:DGQHR domain-containing protein